MLNNDQYTGIVRAVVPAVVGYFSVYFAWTGPTTAAVITAVTAIAAAVWSVLNNKTGKIVGVS